MAQGVDRRLPTNLATVCRDAGDANVISCVSLKLVGDFLGRPYGFEFTRWSNEVARWLASLLDCRSVGPLLSASRAYVDAVVEAMRRVYPAVLVVDAVVETRLAVHVRWPYLPLESGLAWHPVLNVPFIPASSVKGVLRSYAESRGFVELCGFGVDE